LCAALTFGIASTAAIADEDADFCAKLGQHGKKIIQEIYEKKKNLEGSSARVGGGEETAKETEEMSVDKKHVCRLRLFGLNL